MPYPRKYQVLRSLIYHIYNRGNARLEIFHDDEDYSRFISILKKYTQEFDFKIYHWVIMPNHFHLLVEFSEPSGMSRIMAGVTRSYTHYYHKKYSSAGFLFQGRFKSKAIEKETYLLMCGMYVERNPKRAQMVKAVEEYPYSSARYYIKGYDDGLTTESLMFELLGKTKEDRRNSYVRILNERDDESSREVLCSGDPSGSHKFRSQLGKSRGRDIVRRGRPRKERKNLVVM